MFEGADFQVDEDMAAQAAVIEDEVDVVVLPTDGDALLPGLEAEATAEFEQEGLEVVSRAFRDRIREYSGARRGR
jgi:hypothetical protein